MKLLEQQLETALFVRRSRGVELTSAGQHLAEYAIRAMQQLEQGLQQASRAQKLQLCIAAIPALSQLWLVPRLHRFYALNTDIELSIIDQDALVDFSQQAVDLHLHFGSGEFVGLKSQLLMKERALPVCSPDFLAQFSSVTALLASDQVRRLTYTGFEEDKPGGLSWSGWFNQAGLRLNTHQTTTYFNHQAPLVTAAVLGQGIALGWQQLIQPELEKGKLVALSGIEVPLKYSYYAVAPEHHFEREVVKRFLAWIVSECSNH